MKRIIPLLCATITCSASADGISQQEYRSRADAIKKSHLASNQKLIQLGLKAPVTTHMFAAQPGETDETGKKPLFTLHDDGKRLRAEAGKYLFGKTYNRLIVGGEDSPATIALDPNQSLFSNLRALGRARPGGTEGRIVIDVNRIITRQGTTIPIKGFAQDSAGALGLEAQVFSSKALAIAGAMGASFVSGLAASQQTQVPTAFGFAQVEPTGRNALLHGVAQTAADQSKRLLEDSTKEKPVLVVEPGTEVTVYLDEEVKF